MIDLKRILCPVDISDFSEHALVHAMKVAVWFGSKVTVLHVMPPLPPSTLNPGGEIPQRLAMRNLQAMVDRAKRPGVEFAIELIESIDTAARILERVRSLGADLIVMGSHGRKGIPRIVLGSTVETLLHRSGCPILVVPSHVTAERLNEPVSFARILCAVDFSDSSLGALEHAFAIGEESDAQITLLHVIEMPPELKTPPKPPDYHVDDIRAAAERECQARLKALVPESAGDYCTVKTEVAEGGASRQILRTAAAEKIDLIVLGVKDRRKLDLIVFGSDSTDIIRQASCPVLVVPERARVALDAAC